MRDDEWLISRLNQLLELFFPDLEKKNKICIRFKGKWKNKFAHIKRLKDKSTEIAVNGLFKDELVPEHVVDLTIAHELVHYLHGFHSPYERRFRYPHKGAVVDKELKKRGLGPILKMEKNFLKDRWIKIYKEIS